MVTMKIQSGRLKFASGLGGGTTAVSSVEKATDRTAPVPPNAPWTCHEGFLYSRRDASGPAGAGLSRIAGRRRWIFPRGVRPDVRVVAFTWQRVQTSCSNATDGEAVLGAEQAFVAVEFVLIDFGGGRRAGGLKLAMRAFKLPGSRARRSAPETLLRPAGRPAPAAVI